MKRSRLWLWQVLIVVLVFVAWQGLTQPGLVPPFVWDNPDRAAFVFGESV